MTWIQHGGTHGNDDNNVVFPSSGKISIYWVSNATKLKKMKADIRSKNVYNIDEWWDIFARPKLASKRQVCWRCLGGVYWRPDLGIMAVERKRPVLATTAVERKRPSLAVTAVKHKGRFGRYGHDKVNI